MKRILTLAVILFASACSSQSPAVAVATLGIAGAALTAYCVNGGSGCSPELIAYGALITTEAIKDASVLESGSSTVAQLQQIVWNLDQDITQGQALANLTPGQQAEVVAIISAANSVLTLTEVLISKAPTTASVKLPSLSSKDKAALARMRNQIEVAK